MSIPFNNDKGEAKEMSDCYSRKQRMMHWIAKQNVIWTILTVHFSGIRDVISCPSIPCPNARALMCRKEPAKASIENLEKFARG